MLGHTDSPKEVLERMDSQKVLERMDSQPGEALERTDLLTEELVHRGFPTGAGVVRKGLKMVQEICLWTGYQTGQSDLCRRRHRHRSSFRRDPSLSCTSASR